LPDGGEFARKGKCCRERGSMGGEREWDEVRGGEDE